MSGLFHLINELSHLLFTWFHSFNQHPQSILRIAGQLGFAHGFINRPLKSLHEVLRKHVIGVFHYLPDFFIQFLINRFQYRIDLVPISCHNGINHSLLAVLIVSALL